ncbi:helix-turn-helix transcriptional regulator [Erwinia aphidicola]|uniref:helix-turn-helix domain-containing protein n=1 Tax=Erwinia aphidicola TaxID=68334 RepID=UPI0030186D1E
MITRNLKSDWHPADIIAEVRKTGVSLAQLSRENGMASGTLANALKRPWPKGEWIIADRIGLLPSMIWPTRYTGKNITRKPSLHRSRIKLSVQLQDNATTGVPRLQNKTE